MPLQGLRLYGKSKQATTTGANLFDANDVSEGVVDDRNGNIIINTNSHHSNFIAVNPKTKYYLYSNQNIGKWGAFYDLNKTFILGLTQYNTVFETPENAAYVRFTVNYNNNNPDFARNVIFAKSTVALPFEPYTGGKPSPSPEYPQEIVSAGEKGSIGVEITGKNYVNKSKFEATYEHKDGYYYGEIYLQYTNSKLYYDISDFKNGHGYKFSATVKTTDKRVHGLVFEYTDGTFTRSGGEILENTEKTISVVSDKTKIIKACYINYGEGKKVYIKDDISIIDVDEQSIATIPISNGLPGIPVTKVGNYTDENGQQYICDEIDFNRGKYIHRVWKGVFDGSSDEEWSAGSNYFFCKKLPSSMSSREGFSNQYVGNKIRIGNGNETIIIFDADYFENNLSNWKAHLASNPLVVMTYLDAPIETDLTEAQIQAYKSLTTFKPTSIISNDANAWMEVEYACDTKTWVTNKINTLIKEATTS